jgi:hypothetical protein
VPVHAARGGELFLFAEQALHLLGLGEVFERGAADETAKRGGGHDVGVWWGWRIIISGMVC